MKLSAFIDGNVDAILQEWDTFALTLLPAAGVMSQHERRNQQRDVAGDHEGHGDLADRSGALRQVQAHGRELGKYLKSLAYAAFNDGNCDKGTYYLLNNYNSPYTASGSLKEKVGPKDYVAPIQIFPTLVDALSARGITWRWYNGGREGNGTKKGEYSSSLDPLTFFKSVMETELKKNLVSDSELVDDIKGMMPAVAFVTPPLGETGHPNLSTAAAFEAYVRRVVETLQANQVLWSKTAVLVTTDEGGGYYDSGYVQPIDFFGDGPRIPLIVVSPWAKKGFVDHTYGDHVSISKFIERNWNLKPLSNRSRDNLPNPVASKDPYIPANPPAVGDLFEMFDFKSSLH